MKKTIKNYCFTATQDRLEELSEIAIRYACLKNEVFRIFGSLEGLKYVSYSRDLRNEWSRLGLFKRFHLLSKYSQCAFDDAFSSIRSNWSNSIIKTKKNINKNHRFTKDEKHYMFYLLKATDLLYKAITFQNFDKPEPFKDMVLDRDRLHKYLKSRLRKHLGSKPHQYSNRSFRIEKELYSYYSDNQGRLWINVSGLKSYKRIKLLLTSKVKFDGSLIIVLKDNKVEIHRSIDIEDRINTGTETIALDKGFTTLITTSTNHKYGENFNDLLKQESDRLSSKNQKRNKLRFLSKNSKDLIKSINIRNNNLGKKKYNHQKEIQDNKIKEFINHSLNKFFTQENPKIIITEDLSWQGKSKFTKKVNRYLSSWVKGYLQDRIDFKCIVNGVHQVVVNPAYSSQFCHLCGRLGSRTGDKFYCTQCGVLDADYNATRNLLSRHTDKEITFYTSYKKIKEILLSRSSKHTDETAHPIMDSRYLK